VSEYLKDVPPGKYLCFEAAVASSVPLGSVRVHARACACVYMCVCVPVRVCAKWPCGFGMCVLPSFLPSFCRPAKTPVDPTMNFSHPRGPLKPRTITTHHQQIRCTLPFPHTLSHSHTIN
jgi:hypothetical protein